MRHFDYRMIKAVEEERFAQASRSGTRRKRDRVRRPLALHLKRTVGRRMIAFGQRLVAEEVEGV